MVDFFNAIMKLLACNPSVEICMITFCQRLGIRAYIGFTDTLLLGIDKAYKCTIIRNADRSKWKIYRDRTN